MADNYLEKRFEEVFGSGARRKVVVHRNHPSLDTLFRRNRSCRGYDPSFRVTEGMLKEIISVNSLTASAMNRQALRFRPVTEGEEVSFLLSHLKMGGALPELSLPQEGTEPGAFIIVCSAVPEDRNLDIDLGISLQSMGLKAAEMGLSCCIVCAFDRMAVSALCPGHTPLALLAVGKGAESIFLMPVQAGESLRYYRKDGVHYVPKLRPGDLILP